MNIEKIIDCINPEWGEPTSQHYVIRLGERVELVD